MSASLERAVQVVMNDWSCSKFWTKQTSLCDQSVLDAGTATILEVFSDLDFVRHILFQTNYFQFVVQSVLLIVM